MHHTQREIKRGSGVAREVVLGEMSVFRTPSEKKEKENME
jgi:hypothetical protein